MVESFESIDHGGGAVGIVVIYTVVRALVCIVTCSLSRVAETTDRALGFFLGKWVL